MTESNLSDNDLVSNIAEKILSSPEQISILLALATKRAICVDDLNLANHQIFLSLVDRFSSGFCLNKLGVGVLAYALNTHAYSSDFEQMYQEVHPVPKQFQEIKNPIHMCWIQDFFETFSYHDQCILVHEVLNRGHESGLLFKLECNDPERLKGYVNQAHFIVGTRTVRVTEVLQEIDSQWVDDIEAQVQASF